MQNTYKIIILLSTLLCVPHYAKNASYVTGIGHLSLATQSQSGVAVATQSSMSELWRDIAGGYGFLGGLPFSLKIGKSTIQPEVVYNRLSIQATRRILRETVLQTEAPSQNPETLSWSTPTETFASPEVKEIFAKPVHLLGLGIKWHYDIFPQKLQGFVGGVLPFTGICLEYLQSENRFYAFAAPLLIEGGIKWLFYRNMHFTFSGKYALLLEGHLKEHSIGGLQAGVGFDF